MRRHRERGAVMVETALVVGTILTLLLFSLQVGVLGFLQLTSDAASFVNARETALAINPATTSIFPEIHASNISTQTLPAPQPSVPVDYGYNSTSASVQAASAHNRHGGTSMMEPELSQTTVSKPGVFNKLGKLLGVTGQATESYWQECGIHENVANVTSACGDPSAPSNFTGNYFTVGENTPPYFVGFDYMGWCRAAQPWNSCSNNSNFLALGVAEYLSNLNYSITNPGVSGSSGSTTFQAAACHQRVYAKLANFFSYYPTLAAIDASYQMNGYANTPNGYAAVGGICPQLYTNCKNGASTNFYNFANWSAFDSTTNNQIAQVYSWDQHVSGGYPPYSGALPNQYPLNPTGGC